MFKQEEFLVNGGIMRKNIILLFVFSLLFISSAFANRFYNTTAANGAISLSLDAGEQSKGWQLESVKLHLSAVGGAGNFTITVDAQAGATYDVVLLTQDMTSTADILWIPERPVILQNGDNLVFAYANANNRAYGLEVVWNPRN